MVRRKIDSVRGVLATGVANGVPYRHERYYASPDLEDYVEHYWIVEWDVSSPTRVETLPHPSVHMIFERGKKSEIRGASRTKFSRVLKGQGNVFAAKFMPAGFQQFAGTAVSRFTNAVVPFRRVFGTAGDELEGAVLAEDTPGARIKIVEGFLRARLTRAGRSETDSNIRQVNHIVATAANERGILKVDDLVERFGLSKRTLQRLFERYVGVSPKWIIQRYRLHEAAERLVADGSSSQAVLASQLGYSDQAHFVRDFKAIVGVPPAAYARAARRSTARRETRGRSAV